MVGAGGGLEVGPESAGADGRILVRVSDRDQPRAGGLDCGEQGVLFAGGGECGFVVDDRRLRPEADRAVGDRGLERGERVVASVDAGVVKIARRRSAATAAVLVTTMSRPASWWARAMPVSAVLFPVPAWPSIITS